MKKDFALGYKMHSSKNIMQFYIRNKMITMGFGGYTVSGDPVEDENGFYSIDISEDDLTEFREQITNLLRVYRRQKKEMKK